MAEVAYPNPNAEDLAHLTRTYLANLQPGKVKDRLFDRDPRLVTLDAALQASFDEWARVRYRARVDPQSTRREEPMELDVITADDLDSSDVDAISSRELILQQQQELKKLRAEVSHNKATALARAAKTLPRPASPTIQSTHPTQPATIKSGRCFWCDRPGHQKAECRARQAYWRKVGGTPRPLSVEERSAARANTQGN